jgi:predicted nucleic acid-binding protein
MRIVIADTSPLNYLICLGCVDILRALHSQLLAPRAVLAELSHPSAPPEVRAWLMALPHWIEFVSVPEVDLTLPANLGAGEREAISLARVTPNSLLLIDDRDGRLAAAERKIEIAGTMAVLSEASLRGLLDLRETVVRLRTLGFRISAAHESAILERHEERRRAMGPPQP